MVSFLRISIYWAKKQDWLGLNALFNNVLRPVQLPMSFVAFWHQYSTQVFQSNNCPEATVSHRLLANWWKMNDIWRTRKVTNKVSISISDCKEKSVYLGLPNTQKTDLFLARAQFKFIFDFQHYFNKENLRKSTLFGEDISNTTDTKVNSIVFL